MGVLVLHHHVAEHRTIFRSDIGTDTKDTPGPIDATRGAQEIRLTAPVVKSNRPLYRRKSLVQELLRKDDTLRYVDHIENQSLAMLAGALALGLEGIVANDGKSPYVEGQRQTWHWQKVKNRDYKRKEKVEFRQSRAR